jgi:hypothetical protein
VSEGLPFIAKRASFDGDVFAIKRPIPLRYGRSSRLQNDNANGPHVPYNRGLSAVDRPFVIAAVPWSWLEPKA